MNRRTFLTRVFGVVTAAVVGPTVLDALPPPAPPALAFAPDAFAMMLDERYLKPAAQTLACRIDEEIVARYDVLYGVRVVSPEWSVRISA